MRNLLKLVLLALLVCPIISLVSSCSEEADCSMSARPMVQCNLYKANSEAGKLLNDTLDSLTVTAFGTDSIIINKMKKVHAISLPLRYTVDSTVFVLHYSKTNRDTMIVYNTNTPYFLSMDCGYQMKQEITKVSCTRHTLDSLHIKNNEAGIYGQENLQLFY